MSEGHSTNPDDQAVDNTPAVTPTELLIELGRSDFHLIHDAQDRAYGRPVGAGRGAVLRIPSATFRQALQVAHRKSTGRYPTRRLVDAAMEALAAEAIFEGAEEKVFLRSGAANLAIELDLGTDVAVVHDAGWHVAATTASNFLQSPIAQPLPRPLPGGSIQELRSFVNVGSDEDFMLLVGWTVMALRADGPFPLLILQGEQGAAKSTATRVLKALLDPTAADARSAPRGEHHLAIAAENNHVLAFDNLSGLPTWLSDALCRLATGGGFGTRTLYTTDEEHVFAQCRPVILNGIDAIATRQDLLDRSVVIRLERLETYREEEEFWAEFENARPRILGVLLDAVAGALQRRETTRTDGRHRMADFVRWACAALPTFGWTEAEFTDAYAQNHASSLKNSLDGSILGTAIIRLADTWRFVEDPAERCLEGTPTKVRDQLHDVLCGRDRTDRRWPANPQVMSRQLTLLRPALREAGIEVEIGTVGRGSEKERWITISPVAGTQGTQGTHEDDE